MGSLTPSTQFTGHCDTCGTVKLFSVFVRICADPTVGVDLAYVVPFEYRFRCPVCGKVTVRAICRDLAEQLLAAGAVAEMWEPPIVEKIGYLSPLTEALVREPSDDELDRWLVQ